MDVSRKGRNAGGGGPGAWMIWRIEGCLPTRYSRYYYEMSGQMKTLLDRANPLYGDDYHFTDIYLLTSAAEDEEHVPSRAISGLEGWIECFDRAHTPYQFQNMLIIRQNYGFLPTFGGI